MGLIALPERHLAQPQSATQLSGRFREYGPQIVVLPNPLKNIATGQNIIWNGDATRVGGNFHFPGVNGYVDLGADQLFSPNMPCTVVVVAQLSSFTTSFPMIFGVASADGHNLYAFYSNSGSYADIGIGSGSLGATSFPLTQFGSITGTWHKLVFTFDGSASSSGFKAFCNGVPLTPNAIGLGVSDASGNSALGTRATNDLSFPLAGDVQGFQFYSGLYEDPLALEVASTPWMTLRATPRRIFVLPAASGSTGTVNYTNANDSVSASGTTKIIGSLARTNANDTSSASGSTTVIGSLSKTNANDVSSASGTTTVKGNASVTNANDSCNASGSVGSNVSGSVNVTNANDSIAASGTTTIVGSLARTNANDTSTASGTTKILGALSTTNANDSCVASGVAGLVSGTVAYTNRNDICAASGVSGVVSGSLAYTNNNDICHASGTSGEQNHGGHFAAVGYHRKPKERKYQPDDEIRLALIREIEGEQEEIQQSHAPIEVKQQAARIVKPIIESQGDDIAALQQDLTRIRQLLADYQRQVDEDEELLFMFH